MLRHQERGSLLILTVWILVLLSVFAFSVGYTVRQRIKFAEHLDTRENLRGVAEAGVLRMVQLISSKLKGDVQADSLESPWSNNPGLFREVRVGSGFFTVASRPEDGARDSGQPYGTRYGAVDEERKLNLNRVKSQQVLGRLIEAATGMTDTESQDMAAAIMDWRDEDDYPMAGGAESGEYDRMGTDRRPKNAPYDALEELLFVRGITPEIYAKILPYLTLDGSGVQNLNTVSGEVLRAHGFPDPLVKKILLYRSGRDGREGTKDDRVFPRTGNIVTDLNQFVSLTDAERGSMESYVQSGLLGVESQNFLIRSVARMKGRKETLTVIAVAARYGGIKRWREIYS